MGCLEGYIDLPALQPVPCSSRSYMGGEGHWRLVCKYTWSVGCCATWCKTPVPLSCRSVVTFVTGVMSGEEESIMLFWIVVTKHLNSPKERDGYADKSMG